MNTLGQPALTYDKADDDERAKLAQQEIAQADFSVRNVSLVTLTVLAVFYTLYFAASIVLPFLFAMVLNLLLQPAKRLLSDRLRVPSAITSVLLLLVLFGVIAGIATAISVPASGWIAKAPQSLPTLQQRLSFLKGPIDFIQHGTERLEHLMSQAPAPNEGQSSPQSGGQAQGQEKGKTQEQGQPQGQAQGQGQPQSQGQAQPQASSQGSSGMGNMSGVGLTILEGTRAALGQLLTLVVVLFFLLTAGDSLLRGLVEIVPTFGDKRRVVEIANEIERNVSGYLVTITIMNLLVGIANGLQMWALGMPDPLLWGTLAFLLNYIPILGPVAGITMFFFVGLFVSPSVLYALIPPGIYLVIHIIEGETVTPMLLAKRFTLNPVLVIVSLFFWDWLWGVPGALLAVPLLAILKIFCDRIPSLTPLGHMLGASGKKAA